MTAIRRYFLAPVAACMLPVAIGVAWYLWQSRVQSCGFRGLQGEPEFPAAIALIVLFPLPPLATAFVCFAERRPVRAAARIVALAAVLAAGAIVTAELAFILARHCTD
jgi:hypothetical protein